MYRVQDLGPDDMAVFKCGAYGHTAELPAERPAARIGLEPTAKILDLERRLCMPAVPGQGVRPWCRSSGRRRAEPCQAIAIPPFRKVVLGLIDNGCLGLAQMELCAQGISRAA